MIAHVQDDRLVCGWARSGADLCHWVKPVAAFRIATAEPYGANALALLMRRDHEAALVCQGGRLPYPTPAQPDGEVSGGGDQRQVDDDQRDHQDMTDQVTDWGLELLVALSILNRGERAASLPASSTCAP